jgi:hypothetical protein
MVTKGDESIMEDAGGVLAAAHPTNAAQDDGDDKLAVGFDHR